MAQEVFTNHKLKMVHILVSPGPEVTKLEFILRLKIKRNDWLLADSLQVFYVTDTSYYMAVNLKCSE